MTADVRDYLFGYPMFPQVPEPRLSPALYAQSVAINTIGPVISGTTEVGQTLSCTTGTWSFSPSGYRYQWRRDGSAISGATASTHEIVDTDTGKTITCAVVAENGMGLSDPAVSNGLFVPALDVPANTNAPIIDGNTTVGSVLSCTTGTWENDPTSYAYQWRRAGVNISGAITNAYVLTLLDIGLAVTCAVTASNENGPSSPAVSNTITVANIPVNSSAPVISGTTTVGQTLSCATGTWSHTPTGYTYQWNRNGSGIGGATSSTYVLALADAGTTITCTVTASNPQGSSIPATSNSLGIGDIPVVSVAPVISGTPTVGETLSCTTGTWTNSPTSYAYQWKRDGVNIGSATSSTYLLTITDSGTSCTCAVTASNAAGASLASTSNALSITGGGGPSEDAALDFSVNTNSMYFAILDDPF